MHAVNPRTENPGNASRSGHVRVRLNSVICSIRCTIISHTHVAYCAMGTPCVPLAVATGIGLLDTG